MADPSRGAGLPPPARRPPPPTVAPPPPPSVGSPGQRRPTAADDAAPGDRTPARRSPAGRPLAPVGEVSPVDDALGAVARPQARRPPSLPLVAEVSPVDDALGAVRAAPSTRRPSLDLVGEVSPVDDALGAISVGRSAKPGLALVSEIEAAADEGWGDVAPESRRRAPAPGDRLSLVPEDSPAGASAPAPAAPVRRRSNCLLDCFRRRREPAP